MSWTRIRASGGGASEAAAGAPWLAHKASHEGVMVAELIAGKNNVHPVKPESIAGCTYCHPQVASVGYTEAKAKELGYTPMARWVAGADYGVDPKIMGIGPAYADARVCTIYGGTSEIMKTIIAKDLGL